jgi:hypothetical protein
MRKRKELCVASSGTSPSPALNSCLSAVWFAAGLKFNPLGRLLPAFLIFAFSAGLASAQSEAVPAAEPSNPPAPLEKASTGNKIDWKVVTILASSATYDDNILIQPTNQKKDFYFDIDPTIAVGVGNFRDALARFAAIPHFLVRTGEEDLPWKNFAYVSYTPDVVIFSKYHKEDDLNHDARFVAQQERDLWTVKGDLHFQTTSQPNIEVGRRIYEADYTGDVNAAYALSGKVTVGSELTGEHSDYTGGLSSTNGEGTGYVDYQIAPKTTVGIAGAGGYLYVAQGANQPYEQALAQLTYLPTGKLSFNGQAGYEYRQFQSRTPNRSQLVFKASGSYDPTDSTEFTLGGDRETLASAEYADEDIVENLYQAGVRQRFLQRIYLGLTGGYVHDNYQSNVPTVSVARHDNYYFYQPSLSGDVTRYGTVQFSYEHRENSSSLAQFKFAENLYSLTVSFLF